MIVPSELFVEQFVGRAQYASLERLLSLNFEKRLCCQGFD